MALLFFRTRALWRGFAEGADYPDAVLAPLGGCGFQLDHPTLIDAWLGIIAYTVQLYFDFSGWQVAVGLALMMGFRFYREFQFSLYQPRSITEFWRRWHIAYQPAARLPPLYPARRKKPQGRVRTYINLFLTMLLGGVA